LQDRLVREQVRDVVAPFSPYWKQRLHELGRTPSSIDSVAALATLPAAGERDVSPDGDPARLAALVLQASESGFALHASGPSLRRALWRRLTSREEYQRIVDSDTKASSYVWSGLGIRFPVASTRGDLDVIARAGARLWNVLGLTGADALLSAVPVESTTEHVALSYAALASGAPALFPGAEPADVLAAARLAPPTVLAAPAETAAELVTQLADEDALGRLTTLLLVGAPTDEQRAAAQAAAGSRVTVLAVHAPAGARVLWGECRSGGAGAGLHTYPDLEVVQLVDPESGEQATDGGELVLTQLGLRGSALLRWRTGDLTTTPVQTNPCPGCKRRVPRVTGLRPTALVLRSDDGRALDLRAVAGAMTGRVDLSDWRVVVGRRERDGRGQVVAHIVATGDPGEAAVAAAADVRSLAGLLPTQIVAASADEVAALDGTPLTPRILLRG
jgi:phenylacetate-coenzyme A ligase PaaK-like adenylate-forming protein